MGTGYTRNDTGNNIADGNVINAADLDGEFDAVESAFNSSSGHTHDGTSAEGAPIEVVGPTQDVVITASALRPKTDNTVDLGTSALMYKDGFFDGSITTHGITVFDDEGTDATIRLDGNFPTGSRNIAFGLTALDSLDGSSPGGDNIALGNAALTALTTGSHNIAIGSSAGDALITGGKNIAIGFEALSTEDGNGESTAIGYQALKTQNAGASGLNVAVGYLAGTAVSTGVKNTLLGAEAGDAINSGGSNVAVGYNALTATTTSSSNVAVGADALKTNVTGASNVAVGNTALEVATGSNNTAIGKDAGNLITSGASNTIIGQFDGNQGTIQTLDIRTSDSHIVLSDGAGEPRIVVDDSGRVLVGNTSSVRVGESEHKIQAVTTGVGQLSALRYSNGSAGPHITLGHTRSTSVGTVGTAVVDNDVLGQIDFAGDDGADVQTVGARIKAEVEGTPSSNTMPSALTFSTFEVGGSLSEHMRISSSGNIGINTASPIATLHIVDIGTTGPALLIGGGGSTEGDIVVPHDENLQIGHWDATTDTFTSRINVLTSGNVGIGETAPTALLHATSTNASATFRLESTNDGANDGPIIELYRNSPSPAADDDIGRIDFSGENASDTKIVYARIDSFIETTTNGAEDGRIRMLIESGGSLLPFFDMDASNGGGDGRVAINTNANDIDFRVSGDTEANLIYADASTDRVGIGLTPSASDPLTNVSAGVLQVNGNMELRFAGSNSDPDGARYFNIINTDTTLVADQPLGGLQWIGLDSTNPNSNMASITSYCSGNTGTNGDIRFKIAGSEVARIASDGEVGIGTTAPEALLDVAHNLPAGTTSVIRPLKVRTTDTSNDTNLLTGSGVGILFEIADQSSSSIGASIDAVKANGTDDNSSTDLVLSSSENNETLNEVLRIKATGNVSIADGNLSFASGHGIDFSATSNGPGTTHSELLADYEEGSYTVNVFDASSGGNQSSSTSIGQYIKIGSQVIVSFDALNNISTSGLTSGNTIYFGLPFTASTIGRSCGSVQLDRVTFPSSATMAVPSVSDNQTRASLSVCGSNLGDTTIKVSDFNGSTSDVVNFTLSYRV